MSILSLHNITKSYGRIQALNGVSFEVPAGSVFGILGPNGSGKTTLLGIVTDVLKADSGSFTLFDGSPDADARKKMGTLLETPNFYHYLSAYDNLRIAASIKGRGEDDIARVLDIAGLTERQHSKFKTFSLGMKQRLAIASALLGDPGVLVLDEPTNGLDPVGIAEVRNLIRKLATSGKTVIMASHLLDEVEKVCDHVAIMLKGKLLMSGPVSLVISREDYVLELSAADLEGLQQKLSTHPELASIASSNGLLHVSFKNGTIAEDVNAWCFSNGIRLNHLVIRKKSLEAAFFEITKA
ncbi:ABC transporter ATP-binding protein [Chitinophaga horti]|uniref:ABC transporter ATP-binding protein n=1 Tax=Chitinophaga horti TaxID=2920382 RepID=A0ABY6IXN4_9BACT|nr:ABC transporter ATP-binding protein [Chitinophaga horti]UYQ92008.1 ABC transporter ATP-binding protein [Chitinophaga horti]